MEIQGAKDAKLAKRLKEREGKREVERAMKQRHR